MALLLIVNYTLLLFLCAIIFSRKKFDVYSISFIGSMIYFLPIIIPADQVYELNFFVYWAALTCIATGSAIHDMKSRKTQTTPPTYTTSTEPPLAIIKICALASLALISAQISIYGLSDFFANKQDQVRSGYLSVLYSVCVTIGFLYSIHNKSKKAIYFFSAHQIFILLTGDRTNLSIATIGFVLIQVSQNKNFIKKILTPKTLSLFILLFLIGVSGKKIYISASYTFNNGGNFIENYMAIQTAHNDFLESIKSSEPYGIDKMLGVIIQDNFQIDSTYLLEAPIQLIPFSGSFTNSLHFFSNTIKAQYYSDWSDTAGVGATFFGEGYANFGILGIALYLAIFITAISYLNKKFITSRPELIPIYAILSAYWGFYIHRNSLFQMISHTTKYAYVFIAILLASHIIRKMIYKNPSSPNKAHNQHA